VRDFANIGKRQSEIAERSARALFQATAGTEGGRVTRDHDGSIALRQEVMQIEIRWTRNAVFLAGVSSRKQIKAEEVRRAEEQAGRAEGARRDHATSRSMLRPLADGWRAFADAAGARGVVVAMQPAPSPPSLAIDDQETTIHMAVGAVPSARPSGLSKLRVSGPHHVRCQRGNRGVVACPHTGDQPERAGVMRLSLRPSQVAVCEQRRGDSPGAASPGVDAGWDALAARGRLDGDSPRNLAAFSLMKADRPEGLRPRASGSPNLEFTTIKRILSSDAGSLNDEFLGGKLPDSVGRESPQEDRELAGRCSSRQEAAVELDRWMQMEMWHETRMGRCTKMTMVKL
jgi:hypothetical protein